MTSCFARLARRSSPLLALSLCGSATALALDPLNSNNRTDEKQAPITAPPDSSRRDDDPPNNELNVVPVLGGSTDLGFGGGYFAGLARVKQGVVPYPWNIDSSGPSLIATVRRP